MFIRTERLFLRPAWPEDMDDLVEALQEKDVHRNIGLGAMPQSNADISAYLAQSRDVLLPHFFMYARTPEGPALVGGIGLGRCPLDENAHEVEVGYWIAAKHRGHGYAGEALHAVVEHAQALGYHRLLACHFDDCTATHRILARAGFYDTGELRDRYSAGRGMMAKVRIYAVDLADSVSRVVESGATVEGETTATSEECDAA